MAPVAVNVVELPAHSVADDAVALMVGTGTTDTVVNAVDVHPAALLPVNVYTVVDTGDTVTVEPPKLPGFQVYDVAPVPVNVAVAPTPAHIEVGDDIAVIVGLGLTEILTTAELVQVPFDPRTVYVVFTPGDTTTLAPVKLPGFQV